MGLYTDIIIIGLTPGPGRTSDKGNVRRSFLWSVGPSVGGEFDGEGHCRTADGRKFFLLFRTAPPDTGSWLDKFVFFLLKC